MRTYDSGEAYRRYSMLFEEDSLLCRAQQRMLNTGDNVLRLYGERVYAMVSKTASLDAISSKDFKTPIFNILLFCSVSEFRRGDLAVLYRPNPLGKGIEMYKESILELAPDLRARVAGRSDSCWGHVGQIKCNEEDLKFINLHDIWLPIAQLFDSDLIATIILEQIFDFNDIQEAEHLVSEPHKALPLQLTRRALPKLNNYMYNFDTDSLHDFQDMITSPQHERPAWQQWRFTEGCIQYTCSGLSVNLACDFRPLREKERMCFECRAPEKSGKKWTVLDPFRCEVCGCERASIYDEITQGEREIDVTAYHQDLQREEMLGYMRMVEVRNRATFESETQNSFVLPLLLGKHFKSRPEVIPGYDDRRVDLQSFLKESLERQRKQDEIDDQALFL